MPLGPLFLASWVRKHCPEWDVRIIDGNWDEPWMALMKGHYDAVGISAMTCQYEAAVKLAKLTKVAQPHVPVILGGVHVTTAWQYGFDPAFDVLMPNEGEIKLANYLNGLPWAMCAGKLSLQDYPDLRWELLNERYWEPRVIRTWQAEVREATLITSRGCPYKCTFCSTTAFWDGYRTHTPQWIIRQLVALAERGVTHVQIMDDLFTARLSHVREVAQRFYDAGLHKCIKGIGVQSRANLVDRELCDLLRSMNVKIMSFGFESGSQRVLQSLKVNSACVEANRGAVQEVRQAGLRPIGSVMFGAPGETWSDMWRTVAEIVRMAWLGIEDMWMFVATPYPATQFWELAEQRRTVEDAKKNWDSLKLGGLWPAKARLSDVPRWQFLTTWWAARAAMALCFKSRKAWRLIKAAVWRKQ